MRGLLAGARDAGFESIAEGHQLVDLRDDAALLRKGGNRDKCHLELCHIQSWLSKCASRLNEVVLSERTPKDQRQVVSTKRAGGRETAESTCDVCPSPLDRNDSYRSDAAYDAYENLVPTKSGASVR